MNAEHKLSPRATLPSGTRLENLGFGSTLVAMAVAALAVVAHAAAPALDKGGYLADWMESCTTLVTIVWPIASAAIGVAG